MKTQMKFRLAALIIMLTLLCGVMIGRFVYPAYIETVSEAWITQPFQEAKYIIGEYNSTHYYAKNHTGYGVSGFEGYEMLGTNATNIINNALGNLTVNRIRQEKILLLDNIVIDAPLILYNYTLLECEGSVYLSNNRNCNMIESAEPTGHAIYVTVQGGLWDQNKQAQTSGHCVYWIHASQPSTELIRGIRFLNMRINNTDESAIFVNFTGSSRSRVLIDQVKTWRTAGYGIRLIRCADWILTNALPISGGLMIEGGNRGHLSDSIINQGINITNFGGTSPYINGAFSNLFIDTNDEHGVHAESMMFSVWNNIRIAVAGDGWTNKSGILLYGNGVYEAINNTFNNIQIGRFTGTGTSQFMCGINETDADQNNNIYDNVNAIDCITGLSILGNRSHVSASWNSTIFIHDNWITWGNATILNGANIVQIEHGLPLIPTSVLITAHWTFTGINVVPWVLSVNNTHFVVRTNNVLPADSPLYWQAMYDP